MAITATLKIKFTRPPSDARELVQVAADAAKASISKSLIDGVTSGTGTPRPRKGDGKPQGYNTGTLANGLEVASVGGGKSRASTQVVPPPSRAGWVADQGDVLVAGGRVGEAMQASMTKYLKGSK